MQTIVHSPAGYLQSLHRHTGARLVLSLGGDYRERAFSASETCVRGDFVVRPSLFAHDGVTGRGGARYVRLGLSEKAARAFFSRHGWQARCGHINLDESTLRSLMEDPNGGDALLARAPTRPMRDGECSPMTEVARALSGDGRDPIAALAERSGAAPWSLTRAFRRAYGMTPSAFRLQARLQRAMRLAAETDWSFVSIAAEAGFVDQSHFNRALKRATRLTPSALRREIALA